MCKDRDNMDSDLQDQPPQPALQDTNNSDGLQALIPTKNKPALFGYYCGVFGLIPFLGLPFSVAGIILGKKGLAQYKANPTPGAKVHAQIGLILGIFELVIFASFLILIIVANTISKK